jgi:hypothetical protein
MAIVFEAERPAARRVALKLIRWACGAAARQRFAHEVELLGRLHIRGSPSSTKPHGPVRPRQLPYFVNEYVEASHPEYVTGQQCSLASGFRLVARVCDAVNTRMTGSFTATYAGNVLVVAVCSPRSWISALRGKPATGSPRWAK